MSTKEIINSAVILLSLLHSICCQSPNFNITLGYSTTPTSQRDAMLDPDYWWGAGDSPDRHTQDTKVMPFWIQFQDSMIEDLRNRLVNHRRFTPPLEGVGFRYGFNSGVIEEWIHHWAHKYPFREREWYLNKFPMYKANIQGLNIQFIWVKPQVPPEVPVLPLLLLHGWPGSIREFYEALPLLTSDASRGFAVEVVVPSMPGFGFSDAPCRPGLGSPEIAVLMRNLMMRLGHKQFYVQGGDLGAGVSTYMATMFPETVLGYHSNLASTFSPPAIILQLLGQLQPDLVVESRLANRIYPLTQTLPFLLEEMGYFLLQATKPDTVGISLSDSPAGLLAYILEKFSTGTNVLNRDLQDGGLNGMNKDFLIDNLMMYWVPNSMTTAMRFYANTFNKKLLDRNLDATPTLVPYWALQAQTEILYQSPALLRIKFPNLLNATALDYGGHFFAFERPKEFSDSVLDALAAFVKWHLENKDLSLSSEAKHNLREVINISRELQQIANRSDVLRFPENFVRQTLAKAEIEWMKKIESL